MGNWKAATLVWPGLRNGRRRTELGEKRGKDGGRSGTLISQQLVTSVGQHLLRHLWTLFLEHICPCGPLRLSGLCRNPHFWEVSGGLAAAEWSYCVLGPRLALCLKPCDPAPLAPPDLNGWEPQWKAAHLQRGHLLPRKWPGCKQGCSLSSDFRTHTARLSENKHLKETGRNFHQQSGPESGWRHKGKVLKVEPAGLMSKKKPWSRGKTLR